ncbi:hypothetical protein Tco_0658401 [Tanacetum coccineum]
MLASSHYRNVSKQTTRCSGKIFKDNDAICALLVLVIGCLEQTANLFQYQLSQSGDKLVSWSSKSGLQLKSTAKGRWGSMCLYLRVAHKKPLPYRASQSGIPVPKQHRWSDFTSYGKVEKGREELPTKIELTLEINLKYGVSNDVLAKIEGLKNDKRKMVIDIEESLHEPSDAMHNPSQH